MNLSLSLRNLGLVLNSEEVKPHVTANLPLDIVHE